MSLEETTEVYRVKQRVDGLHPTLKAFKGNPGIELLSFLNTMRDALDTAGASEAMGLRVIAYYLNDKARDVHDEQLSSVTEDPEEEFFGHSTTCTWSHIVDALLRRFLTDEVLKMAYNAVTRGCQRDNEDEATFAARISKCNRLCRHVFRKADVVNYFVCGLKPTVRVLVGQQVRLLPVSDRTNIEALKLAAVAIGESQRSLQEERGPEVKQKSTDSARGLGRSTRPEKVIITQPSPWTEKGGTGGPGKRL